MGTWHGATPLHPGEPAGKREEIGLAMIASTGNFLKRIGVPDLPPATSPFDPGYDPVTLEGHLAQSGDLMSRLKLSMACWLIADEDAVHRKIATARRCGVPIVTGGAPFELAVASGRVTAHD